MARERIGLKLAYRLHFIDVAPTASSGQRRIHRRLVGLRRQVDAVRSTVPSVVAGHEGAPLIDGGSSRSPGTRPGTPPWYSRSGGLCDGHAETVTAEAAT